MKHRTPLLAAVLAAFFMYGCTIQVVRPPGGPGGPDDPNDPPVQATPIPEPGPVETFQATELDALVRCTGIDQLPLSRTLDYIACGTLTWEMEGADKSLPALELSIRGTEPRPCLKSPCGGKTGPAGLVVRVTANPKHDSGTPEDEHCGSGLNITKRLALGPLGPDGGVDVEVSLRKSGVTVSTPVDSTFIPAVVRGSFGFGRFLEGAPFRHGERGWLWDEFSIDELGGGAFLKQWIGRRGTLTECPAGGSP